MTYLLAFFCPPLALLRRELIQHCVLNIVMGVALYFISGKLAWAVCAFHALLVVTRTEQDRRKKYIAIIFLVAPVGILVMGFLADRFGNGCFLLLLPGFIALLIALNSVRCARCDWPLQDKKISPEGASVPYTQSWPPRLFPPRTCGNCGHDHSKPVPKAE